MAARVLVVDDEAGMRRSLAILLRREGYAVTEAADGQAALERLGADVHDLVIADLRMEPVSGLELLAQVKRAAPDVEVIVMTAYGTIETAVEAMKLGAFDFITKPFQTEEILLRVRNALDRRRLAGKSPGSGPRSRARSGSRASSGRAPRCRRSCGRCRASRRPTAPCCSRTRAAPARSWWRARSTPRADGPGARSCR